MIATATVRRTRSRSGFTLLETILAVALSALLIALVAAGMRIYTSVVTDRRADVVNARVARVILQRIANDLRSSYTVASDEDDMSSASLGGDDLAADGGLGTGDGLDSTEEPIDATVDLASSTVQTVPGIYGNEYELQVDVFGQFAKPIRYDLLTAAGAEPMSSNLLSDPKVVTYYARAADGSELAGTPLEAANGTLTDSKMILARRVQNRAVAVNSQISGLSDMQTGEQLLSDQVLSIQFAYHDGYEWLSSWDSSVTGLPLAVNITVVIVDPSDDSTDTLESTTDNTFQKTVRIPTAEVPTEDAALTGI